VDGDKLKEIAWYKKRKKYLLRLKDKLKNKTLTRSKHVKN